MEEFVIIGTPQTSWFPYFDFFAFEQIFWSVTGPGGTPFGSLGAALGSVSNPATTQVTIAKGDHAPAVQVTGDDGDTIVVTGKRVDTVSTLIGHISADSGLAAEMQEWHDHNVTWKIEFLSNSKFDQAAAQHGKPDHNSIYAFTDYSQSGNHVADNSTVTTYLLASEGTGSDQATHLVHEMLHFERDTFGNYVYPPGSPTTEDLINAHQDAVYNEIYHGKTVNLDGATNNASIINAPGAGALIYGTGGNDVITATSGSNTIVAYSSNDILKGGSGNDFFKVLGSGAKLLDDTGGTNSIYVPWAHNFYDFKALVDSNGTLFLAPATFSGTADQSPDRLIIPNYNGTHFPNIQYTNTSGQIALANIDNIIAGEHGGGGGHAIILDPDADSLGAGSAPISSFNYVVGTPLAGYYDPYASSGAASSLSSEKHAVGTDDVSSSAGDVDHTSAILAKSMHFHAEEWALL